jgi:hypothetical protein
MSEEVLVALIAALASLVVSIATAIVGYFTRAKSELDLARLENRFIESRSEKAARREYEYEARKRLYAEFQPLLFQLVERCDGALARIQSIADAARRGRLEHRLGEMWPNDPYAMVATMWEMMSPLAFFKLGQRRLTVVDLTVDPVIHAQYLMGRELYYSWAGGNEIAEFRPKEPYDDEHGATRQHVLPGHLEQTVEALIVAEANGQQYCMSFGRFYSGFLASDSGLVSRFETIATLFTNFHPATKPVLWQLLIVQAHIYRALMQTFENSAKGLAEVVHPLEAFSSTDYDRFDWRQPGDGVSREEAVTIPFAVAQDYLQRRFGYFPPQRLASTQEPARSRTEMH